MREGEERPRSFWWFEGTSVIELFRRLAAIGPEAARLEVHPRGEDSIVLKVVPSGPAVLDGDDPPPINESHRCPPQCP